MPCPMPAFIAAFECAPIHESIRFRDEADHLAEWARLPVAIDVDEAKRHDLVSELLRSSIEAAHNADVVASCRCLGCLSAAPSAYALAVSARLLVEQAEAARYARGEMTGCGVQGAGPRRVARTALRSGRHPTRTCDEDMRRLRTCGDSV
jgi:hypothetical protein